MLYSTGASATTNGDSIFKNIAETRFNIQKRYLYNSLLNDLVAVRERLLLRLPASMVIHTQHKIYKGFRVYVEQHLLLALSSAGHIADTCS